MMSPARDSSLRQVWTSSRRPLDSWASRWARCGSCQMLGSSSSPWSAWRRSSFLDRSKMLLELMNLVQQLFGAFEDLFHGLVPVAVLESLSAATGTNIVAADAGKVQRLRALKRRADLGWSAGRCGLGRLRRLGDVLRRHGIGRCAGARLGGLGGRRLPRSRRGAGFLLRHRRKSYPKSGHPNPSRRFRSG